jgi:hypothetical protein
VIDVTTFLSFSEKKEYVSTTIFVLGKNIFFKKNKKIF